MRRTHFTILFLFVLANAVGQDFRPISAQLEKKCTKVSKKSNFFSFHHLRSRLYSGGKLDFINYAKDTLYILENYDIQSGTYIGRIWNTRAVVQYTYNYDSGFKFNNEKIYTDYTIRLVQNWDINSIKEEERLYNVMPVSFIYSSRIIFSNKLEIACFRFKEFYNPKRDYSLSTD